MLRPLTEDLVTEYERVVEALREELQRKEPPP